MKKEKKEKKNKKKRTELKKYNCKTLPSNFKLNNNKKEKHN